MAQVEILSNPAAEFVENHINELSPDLEGGKKFVATLDRFVDASAVPK
jgi:hypothetical protein